MKFISMFAAVVLAGSFAFAGGHGKKHDKAAAGDKNAMEMCKNEKTPEAQKACMEKHAEHKM